MRVVFAAALLIAAAALAQEKSDKPPPAAPERADAGTPDDKTALEEMLEEEEKAQADDEKEESAEAAHAATPARKPRPRDERRGEIADEVGLGSTQSTPENPRAGQLTNLLRGSLYLSEKWTLNAALNFTAEGGAPAPAVPKGQPQPRFQSSYGGNVALFSVGADYDLNEHFTFGAHLDASPNAQQFFSTTFDVNAPNCPNQVGQVYALIKNNGSSLGAGASAGYDSAGDSDLEMALTLSVMSTDLNNDQRLSEGQCIDQNPRTNAYSTQIFTLAQFRAYCASHPAQCALHPGFRAVLRDDSYSLLQTRATAAATVTAWVDTDLTLSGEYYSYSDDPSKLGFFGPVAAGLGTGLPIAPLRWMSRAEIAHRFGRDFSARLWLQHGEYVAGTGQYTSAIGLKLQYKLSRAFRIWLTATGQKDLGPCHENSVGAAICDPTVDPDIESKTGTLGLGAAYKF